MNDAYFCWLIRLVGDGYIEGNYQKLLWKLYVTDYIWELDYDRNRAADGVFLRKIFKREYGEFAYNFGNFGDANGGQERPCSVLEMMVALARKAENDIMHDPDFGDRSSQWFWTMLENLGLDVYDDYHFFEEEVDRILDIFLHRRYENNGSGGAFPIRNRTRDLRKTDLWWQMNAYLEEHYPV